MRSSVTERAARSLRVHLRVRLRVRPRGHEPRLKQWRSDTLSPMTPRNRKRLTIVLGVAGFAALLYYFGNRKGSLSGLGFMRPKYRHVQGKHKPAPLVGSTENGGMRTELRSSETMPIEERIGSIQDLIFKG